MEKHSGAMAQASARLSAALDGLEATVRRHQDARRGAVAQDAEIQLLAEDRSRLAQELDRAEARASRLESAASHVGARLDAAIQSIGKLVERQRVS